MMRTTKDKFRMAVGVKPEGNGNQKHKLIKPEDLRVGCWYAFSPNPEDVPDETECLSFKKWWDEHVERFKSYKSMKVRLFCEYSCMGKFHFHGFIKIVNKHLFYLKDCKDMIKYYALEMDCIGNKNDDHYEHYMQWLCNYCLKNQLDMQPYLEAQLLPKLPLVNMPDGDQFLTIST